jgi:hypothetical protein
MVRSNSTRLAVVVRRVAIRMKKQRKSNMSEKEKERERE